MRRETQLVPVVAKVARSITSNFGVKVIFKGTQAWTDGKIICLPAITTVLSKEAQDKLRGFCYHECGHISYTDWEATKAAIKAKKINVRAYKNLWNWIEDVRIEREASRKYFGVAQTLEWLWKSIEEPENLSVLKTGKVDIIGQIGFAFRQKHTLGSTYVPSDHDEAIQWLMEQPEVISFGQRLDSASNTQETLQIAHELLDYLKELIPPAESQQSGGDVHESEEGSEENSEEGEESSGEKNGKASQKKKPSKRDDKSDNEDDEDSDGEEGEGEDTDEDSKDGESDEGSSGNESEKESKGSPRKGKKRKSKEENTEDEEEEAEGEGAGDVPKAVKQALKKVDFSPSEEKEILETLKSLPEAYRDKKEKPPKAKPKKQTADSQFGNPFGFGYSDDGAGGTAPVTSAFSPTEKMLRAAEDAANKQIEEELKTAQQGNHRYTVATYSQDSVEEVEPHPAKYNEAKGELGGIVGVMADDLERELMSKRKTRYRADEDEGEMDIDALVDISASQYSHTRLFSVPVPKDELNVAVTILTDNSGSMCDKIDLTMQATIALHEALIMVEIPHEVLGFTTGGSYSYGDYHNNAADRTVSTRNFIYKGFSENNVCTSIGGMAAYNANADGEAVAWAARRLLARSEKRKVLVVLCDGWPSAGSSSLAAEYQYLKDIVKDTIDSGIEVFALGIMCDSVKNFYPHWSVLESIGELPKALLNTLRDALLKGAAHEH